ncbi:RING finger [Fusarium albosuccineum]|uniref:RING finger n=1 Tax=Fusarium albosuccineum TaxID=1237068 RepID=A0A8H4P649_9HYPO|nr:RING finger [Fusarium albosuccineum]
MDPMDYMLHNHHRSTGHYDPVHSPPSHWMPHPQTSPPYPWQTQNPSLHQSYPHHPLQPAPGSDADPFQLGHHGGMLPPMLGLPPVAFTDNLPGAVSPRPSGRHQTYHRGTMPPPGAPTGSGTASHNHDGAFANQIPGGRPLNFQPPISLNMPPVNAGPEPNPMQRPPYSLSDPSTNAFGQNNTSSHFVPAPPPPHPSYISAAPPVRRGHFSSASVSSRAFRDAPSPTSKPSPSPRPWPWPSSAMVTQSGVTQNCGLARPSLAPFFVDYALSSVTDLFLSLQGRLPLPLVFADLTNDNAAQRRPASWHQITGGMTTMSPNGSDASDAMVEEALLRHMQVVRGSVSTKMVASKMTLQSLQSVKIEDLAEADRSCVICYNDYGVKTPEGISEAPLRLPKCGHVFGDHCIKKWFEDSDSCPYCRDKLHAEPKQQAGASARAFLNMMRTHSMGLPSGATGHVDDVLNRALNAAYSVTDRNGSPSRQSTGVGRRSPPSDVGERQRRIRPRHNNANTHESGSLSGGHGRGVSSHVHVQRAAPGAPLIGPSYFQQESLSPRERDREWMSQLTQASNGGASTAPQRNTSPPSAGALSPLATMYTMRGGQQVHVSRPVLSRGESSSQNSTAPPFRNPMQGGVPLVVSSNSENTAQGAGSQQGASESTQNNRNRPW